MAEVVYSISGTRFGTAFSFDLILETADGLVLGRKGKWRISKASRLDTLAPLLTPGGTWRFRKYNAGGFIFLNAEGRERSPFDIALDNVPDDYVHGPFCSIETGKGTVSASVKEDISIQWRVAGPGCV